MSVFKIKTTHWYIVRVVYLMAGIFTGVSSVLVITTGNTSWVFLSLFVGLMQIIFAITGYCPSAIIMDKLGVKQD